MDRVQGPLQKGMDSEAAILFCGGGSVFELVSWDVALTLQDVCF